MRSKTTMKLRQSKERLVLLVISPNHKLSDDEIHAYRYRAWKKMGRMGTGLSHTLECESIGQTVAFLEVYHPKTTSLVKSACADSSTKCDNLI